MIVKTRPSEYDLFVKYGRLTKQLLQEVFKLSRYPDDENTQVAFMTPPRAYVKFLVPVLNGGNINPTVTFYYDSFEYLENENMGGYYNERKLQPDGRTYKLIPAPLIYKLNFKIIINTATPMDADKLQYQILAYCRKNKPAVKFYEGQWVEWIASNPADEAESIPGSEDKVAKRSCTLSIRRAYLPVDFTLVTDIEQINATIEMMDEIGTSPNGEIQYSVDYDSNTSSNGAPPVDTLLYDYGDQITLPENDMTKQGYEFIGWSLSPIPPLEYEILTVSYSGNTNSTGVPPYDFNVYESGDEIELAETDMTKQSYDFSGWSDIRVTPEV